MKDGRRPDCASCNYEQRKKNRQLHAVDAKIYDMASGILRRTSGKGRNCRSYEIKGIECLIGNTRDEVITYINKHFRGEIEKFHNEGKIASIDRIDSNRHYEHRNLRIIEFVENARLGAKQAKIANSHPLRVIFPNGDIEDFPSISDAAKTLKCKRDTIYGSLKQPGINRRGLRFELLKKDA